MSEVAIARALSKNVSWKVLDRLMIGESTKSGLARQLGVPSDVVASAVEQLVRVGLVSQRETTNRSGTVELSYALSGDAKSIGFPPRNYLLLSKALMTGLVTSLGKDSAMMILRDVGVRAGEEMGQRFLLMTKQSRCDPDDYADLFVERLLAEMGTRPRVVRKSHSLVEYEQLNCPFQELANELPGLVCDVLDEGVHQGLDNKLGVKTNRLSCKGHGAVVCRFRAEWPGNEKERGSKAR